MPRYINADALLAEAKRLSGPQTGDGWDNWGVYALIERQPTADVVEVVRCKDCKHFVSEKSYLTPKCIVDADWDEDFEEYFGFVAYPKSDFFCARGERREAK